MLPELVERPRGERAPLVAAKPYPVPDPVEFLDGDPATGALRDGHDLLADPVVQMGGMTVFLLAPPGEAADGRPGLLDLEFGAFAGLPPAVAGQTAALVVGAV